MNEKIYTIIRQHWIERERGWGFRPDDDSLHLTMEDRDAFVAEYWEQMPDSVPNEYISPECKPKLVEVNELTYQVLSKQRAGELPNELSRHGIWLFRHAKYKPADWFCKRMEAQGFQVSDFAKRSPAQIDQTKHRTWIQQYITEGMGTGLFGQ